LSNTMQKNNEKFTRHDLQEEIDELIEENDDIRSVSRLESTLVRELQRDLPKGESLAVKKIGHHTEILVTNETKRGAHSPYVLDLSELAAKRRLVEEKKKNVRQHLHGTIHKNDIHADRPMKTHYYEARPLMPAHHSEKKTEEYSEQFTKKRTLPRFYLPLNWRRNLMIFIGAGLFFAAPIKLFSYFSSLEQTRDQVVEYANSAMSDLKLASTALAKNDLSDARQSFGSAEYNFGVADSQIEGLNGSIKAVLENFPSDKGNLSDAQYLISAGEKLSGIGAALSDAISAVSGGEEKPLLDKIAVFQEKMSPLIANLKQASDSLQKVNPEILPTHDKDSFIRLQKKLEYVVADAEELDRLTDALNHVLGKDNFRRYLFVFQNNNELRPTGGFMGSFAVVDIDNGEIKKIEIPGGGTYDVQGQLTAQVNAPAPLTLVNPKWEFQDANWFPDFRTSAQKIAWFYEKSGGPTVDGVIAINATVIPKLIAATEPITLPKYGKTLNADNFIIETQKSVQFEYDKAENKPKQLLSDMAPILIENIFKQKGEKMMDIAKLFKTALDEKEIQLYFVNEGIEKKFSDYNWTGEIKNASKDYLEVVSANIRGSKSDQFINQTVDVSSDILENGEIMNTVSVTRTHIGKADDIFGKDSNIDYLRFYVPDGAELLYATGFSEIPETAFEKSDVPLEDDRLLTAIQGEVTLDPVTKMTINNEFHKTVFGAWIQIDAGESKTAVIKYKLPFKLDFNKIEDGGWFSEPKTASVYHSLLLQKQSGAQNIDYHIKIQTPFGKNVSWQYPAGSTTEGNVFSYATEAKYDELMALVID
jgi:hypothetical protein